MCIRSIVKETSMFTIGKQALRYLVPIMCLSSLITLEAQANDDGIEIDVSEEGIRVVAEKKKLSDVLMQLGQQADFTVTGAETIDVMFNGQIESADVEELLKRLGVNSILIWDDTDNALTLKEIILLSASEEGSDFLPSGDTESASTANNEVASQQLKPKSSTDRQSNSQSDTDTPSAKTNSSTDTADSDSSGAGTTPGFGFSIDPNSASVNPQQ